LVLAGNKDTRRELSRRDFLKGAAAGAALAAGGSMLGGKAEAALTAPRVSVANGPDACDGSHDLVLQNGNILTLDGSNTVDSTLQIKDGKFADVGHAQAVGPCSHTVNLKGATVIPGLIDSHVHFIRNGINPGHEVRIIETATSIAELQQMIGDRAKSVPQGEFITCIGGWNRNGFAEKRLPTPAELDSAAPHNPVYLSETGGGGRGVTNTAGAAFFTAHNVSVDANGIVSSTGAAQNALVSVQTEADKARGTAEVIDFSAGLGLTMVHDMGGLSGLGSYKYSLDLWRQGDLNIRIRFFFWSGDDTGISSMQARITNNLNQLGDELYRPIGVGERINTNSTSPLFPQACSFAAANGWTLTQHSLSATEIPFHIGAYQQAAQSGPIDKLRWSLAHVNPITDSQIATVKQMGIGLNIQGWQYTATASPSAGGPPFRKLLDAGIPCGGGTDATNVGPINPWLMMYYMTTGKNNNGDVINDGQSISRLEALKMYTSGSAYLSFDDDKLGTIEAGKLADLVVLSDDPTKASDDKLRKLSSQLTLQAGKAVHATGAFAGLAS
jgi:hypothetical protein